MVDFLDTYPEPLTPPPPGGVAPNDRGTAFIVIVLLTFVIAMTFGGIRIYTKAFITRALGWDDYTCMMAMVCNIGWTVVGINMAMKGMGRHLEDVHDTYRMLAVYHHNAFAVNMTYFATIMLVKLSILFLYIRAFTESRIFRWTVQALMSMIIISHVGFIIMFRYRYTRLECHWLEVETDEEWEAACPEHYDNNTSTIIVVFIAVLTVVLDLIILVLPCSPVWRLHLPRRQKLAILITLISGVVVTLASILRLVFLVRRFWFTDDFQFTEWQVNLTSTIEINLALVCISLPVFKAFARRFFPKILRLASSTREGYFKGTSGDRTKGSQVPAHHASKASRKWNGGSHEEDLVSHAGPAGYLELGEDAKSDQNIAMNVIEVKTAIDIESQKGP